MAAEGLIDFDELRAKLAGLEETRETARRELEALKARPEDSARVLLIVAGFALSAQLVGDHALAYPRSPLAALL